MADAATVPSNKDVFNFVKELLEAGTVHLSTYEKKGFFARQMSDAGSVNVAYTKTEDHPDSVFVYHAAFSTTSAHDVLMLCPGDALVYRAAKTKVHTMEQLAVQNNHRLAPRS